MKFLKFVLPLLVLMSPLATNAWERVDEDLYSIYGTRISQSAPVLQPFAEIVYNSRYDSFGVSFLSTDGKRTTIQYGIFRLRTCAMDTVGAVAGPILRDPASEDQMDKIFTECNRPMFFRIWDTSNNYTLYKFENVGPIDKD